MRVIAGDLRGRKLVGPRGTGLRPTGDRLRETLFNILGHSVRGCLFLDVFAGTGSVGIEALSRGAREVVFIEADPGSCRIIRRNLEICGLRDGVRLEQQDVFTSLRRLAREGLCADLVFFDPPYDWGPYDDLLQLVFGSGLVHGGSRVIVEHHRKTVLRAEGENCRCTRVVRQGDSRLSFYALQT